MVHFFMHIFKRLHFHSIYWAIEYVRAAERVLEQPVAYCYIIRDANCIANNIARRALEAWATITFWDGQVPEDAPRNLLQDISKQ